MAGLLSKVTRFASSPQGKQALAKAKEAVSDPKNKAKANELLERAKGAVGGVTGRGGSDQSTTTPAGTTTTTPATPAPTTAPPAAAVPPVTPPAAPEPGPATGYSTPPAP